MKQGSEEPARLLGRLAENIDGILDAEMSSALQNLVQIESKLEGDLSDQDMPLLLGRMFSEGATGRLVLREIAGEKSVYFEAGLPVMAASTDPSDRMLAMLMRENAIEARQYEETVRMVDATGRKVGAVLVDLGFLRSDELLPAVRRHYESIILTLFSWSEGHWHIEPNVTAGPDRTRLLRHPAALVREGLDRGYPAERISTRLGAGKNVFLLDNSTAAADLAEQVVLARAEGRVPMLFDGIRSLEEVARIAEVPEPTVLRIAFTLSCFGSLRPVEANATARMGARAGLRDVSIDRERIQARHALATESDYFKMLGVDRSADASEVRRAHARLTREIAPETLGPELWHEQKAQIETIREVLDEGLRILCTPSLRSAYEFNLAHGPDADGDGDGAPKLSTPSPTRLSKG
jgi:hypothetical protein